MSLDARVLAASPWLAGLIEREPQHYTPARLQDPQPYWPAEWPHEDAALMRQLRRVRNTEMARIAYRDLAGLAPLDETLGALSSLAERCCQQALDDSLQRLAVRYGRPRDEQGRPVQPVILGMGKLGGGELNFSSDIDLICTYTAPGETDGEVPLSNSEFFAKLVQRFTRLLAEVTPDGFAYRVDWMLRPFGSAGAPAASFAAMEEYYLVHGREWERYALIKARPVAGDLAAGQRLLGTLRPFIYRRYLDFTAIGSLRALKQMIEDEVRRKGLEDNVKLGRGGIREVEFIVQSFQLVRGGQEPPLRDPRLRPVLAQLGACGMLEPATAQGLDQAYVFLRRLENAIQMYGDEQTHALPTAESARRALAVVLGHADWEALLAAFAAVRKRVRTEFDRIFAEASGAAHPDQTQFIAALWQGTLDEEAAIASLRARGWEDPQRLVRELRGLREVRLVRAMREDTVNGFQALLGQLLTEACELPQASQTALLRVLGLLEAVAGRATYLSLLRESATARLQLLRLCAASPWLADLLRHSPMLLDQLLDPRSLHAPPTRAEMEAELAQRSDGLPEADIEGFMDLLRRYQKEITLRVAAADLEGSLPLVQVSDRLTWLAEVLLARALDWAWREMVRQHGTPQRADGQPAGFAVIAYGKFGGIEMGYGSDLDLVFIHDCDDLEADTRGGERPLAAGTWMARFAQRLINLLATQTQAGRAYEVDLELRPSGKSGLVVTSLAGFERYQREQAWTWEHQALTRARPVAGSARLAEAFARLRTEVLTREREPQALREEIRAMRDKMRSALDTSGEGLWDVKQGRGGLTDAEFITQYLVLRDAARDPAIVHYSDNWRQLDALLAAGSLSAADHDALIGAYRSLRGYSHARALQNEDARAPQARFAAERETISRIWDALLG
ncbi:MAG: bifunctional [glutamate--ammonia ligase]-adenylyl-L-tyrosine phosphorylase/[glutamate--ammonia-ligase] adenylyltransferase [Gammaproteobacteria bacterium]